jgi:hypothetical protein
MPQARGSLSRPDKRNVRESSTWALPQGCRPQGLAVAYWNSIMTVAHHISEDKSDMRGIFFWAFFQP